MVWLDGIEGYFGEEAQRRGAQYLAQGRVRLTESTSSRVRAVVTGTTQYFAEVLAGERAWSIDCSCPAFRERGPCKHLWAVVLASRSAHRTHGMSSPTAAPPERDWRAGLAQLEGVGAEPPATDVVPRLALRYLLHTQDAAATGVPQIETQIARRSARGAFVFRSMSLQPAPQGLAPEDLGNLGLLWSATPGAEWLARTRWPVPAWLQPTLLPLLAVSRRLHLVVDGAIQEVPLEMDPGPPFRLSVALHQDGEQLVLTGRAQRADETLNLHECSAILAGGVLVARGRVSLVEWSGVWGWAQTLRREGPMRVPAVELRRVLGILARTPDDLILDADEFIDTVGGVPRGLAQLTFGRERGLIDVRLLFVYGAEPLAPAALHAAPGALQVASGALQAAPGALQAVPGALQMAPGALQAAPWAMRVARGTNARVVQRGDRLVRVVRDPERELALEGEMAEAGAGIDMPEVSAPDGVVSASALPGFVRTLVAAGWQIEAEGRALRTNASASVSVSSGIDWLDVQAGLDFGDVQAGMPDLLRAMRDRQGFLTLSDGSVGLIPERWLESWASTEVLGELDQDKLRVPSARAWLLDAWLEGHDNVHADVAFEKARASLRSGLELAPIQEPSTFHGELRAYQREGLGWLGFLSQTGFGGCLADDMGLGKTVQVLALLLERRPRAKAPALVVAPRSVLHNWQTEAARFAPSLRVLVHHGTGRARSTDDLEAVDLVVTTYGTMRQDGKMLSRIRFDCAVLDEAQSIKNPKSVTAEVACVLKADLRLALTGTPVENHLGDLRSIFTYLNPHFFRGNRRLIEMFEDGGAEPKTARLVARALRPFLLRRTKEQVLRDLPPKSEQVLLVDLEGRERRDYDELRQHCRAKLLAQVDEVGLERSQMHVLEALLRLRQASCHPGLIDSSRVLEPSAKLEALLPMLDDLAETGHKALIFSQFTSMLAIVRQRLEVRGLKYEYLDGATTKREECVRRFQEDASIPLFLISLKAGGFGLNLTSADYVFLLDPWWNPAAESQAIDRTHRIGQQRPVTAYRLIASDTIEEKVLELQRRKRSLADALFEGTGTTLRDLTRADLDWLLE